MKLSKLTQYVNTVNNLSTQQITNVLMFELNSILSDIVEGNENIEITDNIDQLQFSFAAVLDNLKGFESNLMALKLRLQQEKTEVERDALAKSYQLYEGNQGWPNPTKFIINRHLYNTWMYKDEDRKYYRDRISLYGSWQHAGMIIRPLKGTIIDCLLPCDPLYIVDEAPGLFTPIRGMFNKQYQRRLRYKQVKEKQGPPYLINKIPNNQLSFILVNEFFNDRPIEIIKTYLEEFLLLLKPGGVVLLTYNDCDYAGSVKNFEANLYTYVPGRLLKHIIEGLGYEVLQEYHSEYNVHWLEIKKPGELTTIRGGQTLGVIKKINAQNS